MVTFWQVSTIPGTAPDARASAASCAAAVLHVLRLTGSALASLGLAAVRTHALPGRVSVWIFTLKRSCNSVRKAGRMGSRSMPRLVGPVGVILAIRSTLTFSSHLGA